MCADNLHDTMVTIGGGIAVCPKCGTELQMPPCVVVEGGSAAEQIEELRRIHNLRVSSVDGTDGWEIMRRAAIHIMIGPPRMQVFGFPYSGEPLLAEIRRMEDFMREFSQRWEDARRRSALVEQMRKL